MVIEKLPPDKEAALFRTQKTINQLDAFYQQYHKALYGGDVVGIILSNRNFHYTMYEATNMPILQQVITGLWDQWAPYLYLSLGRT